MPMQELEALLNQSASLLAEAKRTCKRAQRQCDETRRQLGLRMTTNVTMTPPGGGKAARPKARHPDRRGRA